MYAQIKIMNAECVAGDDAYPYWVARLVDGKAWFWGAYSSEEKAETARKQLGGEAFIVKAMPTTRH